MCKRYSERVALDGPSEGPTMRFDLPGGQRARSRCASFPWWALWLIWPLLLLAKWAMPLTLGTIAALGAALGGAGLTIAAVAMIVIGGALLLQREQ